MPHVIMQALALHFSPYFLYLFFNALYFSPYLLDLTCTLNIFTKNDDDAVGIVHAFFVSFFQSQTIPKPSFVTPCPIHYMKSLKNPF
jgi:hypothetical protein